MRLGSAENLLGLGNREGDAFAEGVDSIGKAGLGRRRQGLIADETDVVGAPVSVVRREGVGAEEGRADIDRPVLAKLPRHPQHFQFGVDIKTVARLYLDGRNALCQ